MKYIIILFASLIFEGCSKQLKSLDTCTYPIDVDKSIESDFFTIVDSISFIKLETTEENLIGEIGQLIISDKIILSDRQTNQLMQFSLDGKNISVLSKVGNGPGEYIRLDAFYVDLQNAMIIILDAMQNKIIYYSEDGHFLREAHTPLPYGPKTFSCLAENEFYVFEQDVSSILADFNYNLFICQENMTNPTMLLPFTQTSSVVFSPRITFYHVNDTLVYVPTYKNTIYNVFKDKVEARARIDFGDKWVKDAYIYNPNNTKDPRGFIEGLEKQNFVYFFNELENNTHLYVDFYYQGTPYIYVYNKLTRKGSVLKSKNKEGFGFKGKPLSTTHDRFIIPITYSEFKKILNNTFVNFNHKESIIQQFSDIKEDNNPILMFVKFK